MKINLHIERLVLDGLPATGSQGALVRAAVESELARLFAGGNLNHLQSGAVPYAAAAPIQLTQNFNPSRLGHQIAIAIHGSIRPRSSSPRVMANSKGAAA